MVSDADAAAAHAAGSQLMTSAELCVRCSAPAAAQRLVGQRANRDRCCFSDLALNVKNKHAQKTSKSSVTLPFLSEHRSLQHFSSRLLSFPKLDTMFSVLHHWLGVTRILIPSKRWVKPRNYFPHAFLSLLNSEPDSKLLGMVSLFLYVLVMV